MKSYDSLLGHIFSDDLLALSLLPGSDRLASKLVKGAIVLRVHCVKGALC